MRRVFVVDTRSSISKKLFQNRVALTGLMYNHALLGQSESHCLLL